MEWLKQIHPTIKMLRGAKARRAPPQQPADASGHALWMRRLARSEQIHTQCLEVALKRFEVIALPELSSMSMLFTELVNLGRIIVESGRSDPESRVLLRLEQMLRSAYQCYSRQMLMLIQTPVPALDRHAYSQEVKESLWIPYKRLYLYRYYLLRLGKTCFGYHISDLLPFIKSIILQLDTFYAGHPREDSWDELCEIEELFENDPLNVDKTDLMLPVTVSGAIGSRTVCFRDQGFSLVQNTKSKGLELGVTMDGSRARRPSNWTKRPNRFHRSPREWEIMYGPLRNVRRSSSRLRLRLHRRGRSRRRSLRSFCRRVSEAIRLDFWEPLCSRLKQMRQKKPAEGFPIFKVGSGLKRQNIRLTLVDGRMYIVRAEERAPKSKGRSQLMYPPIDTQKLRYIYRDMPGLENVIEIHFNNEIVIVEGCTKDSIQRLASELSRSKERFPTLGGECLNDIWADGPNERVKTEPTNVMGKIDPDVVGIFTDGRPPVCGYEIHGPDQRWKVDFVEPARPALFQATCKSVHHRISSGWLKLSGQAVSIYGPDDANADLDVAWVRIVDQVTGRIRMEQRITPSTKGILHSATNGYEIRYIDSRGVQVFHLQFQDAESAQRLSGLIEQLSIDAVRRSSAKAAGQATATTIEASLVNDSPSQSFSGCWTCCRGDWVDVGPVRAVITCRPPSKEPDGPGSGQAIAAVMLQSVPHPNITVGGWTIDSRSFASRVDGQWVQVSVFDQAEQQYRILAGSEIAAEAFKTWINSYTAAAPLLSELPKSMSLLQAPQKVSFASTESGETLLEAAIPTHRALDKRHSQSSESLQKPGKVIRLIQKFNQWSLA
ncbi:uncharacterized protein BJ171DRAFT_516606 [Polychytrium aggregatum]|uniref:uncharacterized protein n=1 Tax=Polychytrium aggregatum TaxID=110093 RepID=UPI0022FF2AED|nr:uncharacterized protein BJ171DRAFT_516606 [Polychytrium aggregatum]KAI9201818.1 hypothetical protein BJ171DRAFT_516606 [Polychytrium aggregatum]